MTDTHNIEGYREDGYIVYRCDLCGYEVKVSTGRQKKIQSNEIAKYSEIRHISVFKEREGPMAALSEFINIEFGDVSIGEKVSLTNPVIQIPFNYN